MLLILLLILLLMGMFSQRLLLKVLLRTGCYLCSLVVVGSPRCSHRSRMGRSSCNAHTQVLDPHIQALAPLLPTGWDFSLKYQLVACSQAGDHRNSSHSYCNNNMSGTVHNPGLNSELVQMDY